MQYLGSMEIGFAPGDAATNNKMAIETMRKVRDLKITHDNLVLNVGIDRISLFKHEQIIMRHSTCRYAGND